MAYTQEYELGWGAWAESFGFHVQHYNHYSHYTLPPDWKNGWISEVHPAPGLFAASAWFKPAKTLNYTMHINRPCLWIFCIDCGDITIVQKGKSAYKLTPFNRMLINPGSPLRITIPADSHACFTSVLIFDDFIETFLTTNNISYPIRLKDAKLWKPQHVDHPNIMLILEQIRWGIRGNRMPAPAYLCKAIELLCMIAHNAEREKHLRSRRQYVTWNDEMKLYRVSERIVMDPLNPPTIEEMCRLAEMSESKLRISFKSLYGLTLFNYMREAVMKRAMQMLADDELNIKNIAALCGYENPAKFTAVFKHIHGITPSEFRKSFDL
jgi:AraC-like DNA-binding protein